MTNESNGCKLVFEECSNWVCYMFGTRPGGSGLSYSPKKGQVPNRFVRFMMRICFDCLWVKENNDIQTIEYCLWTKENSS